MDVAVVILNWNGRALMERFVPVLLDNIPKENCFVVVADNASTDDSLPWLQANYPQVEVIALDQNYGFAGGYNRALKMVEADYYVLLNSDVEVSPGWLETLVDFMEDNPDVGVCQPKIRSVARRDCFEYAGAAGGYIDRYGYPFCRGRILSNIEKDNGQYDEPDQCFWASGACMMVRSDLYHYLGGLDELFRAHMEEIDFCWRAKLAGHQVWAVPQAVVYHVGGGSLDASSPRKLYLNYRNSLLMLQKNLPVHERRKVMAARKFMDFCASLVYLFTGRWSYFKAVWQAKRDFRRLAPEVEVSSFTEDGTPTEVYDLVQEMNEELQARAGVFMGCKVTGVYQTGDHQPNGTSPLTGYNPPLSRLNLNGGEATVSFFENGKWAYLMLVNRSYQAEYDYSIIFEKDVQMVNRDGSVENIGTSLDSHMEAGDCAIFRWKK